jgi:hypothetical protein
MTQDKLPKCNMVNCKTSITERVPDAVTSFNNVCSHLEPFRQLERYALLNKYTMYVACRHASLLMHTLHTT